MIKYLYLRKFNLYLVIAAILYVILKRAIIQKYPPGFSDKFRSKKTLIFTSWMGFRGGCCYNMSDNQVINIKFIEGIGPLAGEYYIVRLD